MQKTDPLLTVSDVAHRTSLKRGTIYVLAHKRRLSSIKLGSALRFRLSDVEKWIKQGERPARKQNGGGA